ncbi:MAG: ribose 5-phosphate isomerase B [Desulfobulbus sp.]|jgi:ribose 5-phosphate isomerase B|uniref:ribose 5-phosphate isomerase B n=1 Tax=uncultured Desulfobulbus sp. TaxID=239745 RepID=UPI001B52288E|nr:ribose 5-phosphate isomerase B [uncultured Desulfobulbus sp.]MBP7517137.1 ribose 5-phosphate isomerase B [Desulfobulbus sp.]
MNVAVGCDHGGFTLKREIVHHLLGAGHEVNDVGCPSEESVDYPEFAERVCAAVLGGQSARGILICGTGIGMAMAANRHRQIRAALCHEPFSARMSREHNDANVLCLGGRVLGPSLALEIVRVWMETGFAGGRHLRRITMMG